MVVSMSTPTYITGYEHLLDVVRQNVGPYSYEPTSTHKGYELLCNILACQRK